MGFGGISIGSLILIFLIVLVLFGTKRLRHIGEDLGHAVKQFRKGLEDSSNHNGQKSSEDQKGSP